MLCHRFLLIFVSVLIWHKETRGSEGSESELEKLVDAYVDTYRRLLTGPTTDELLTSLKEDPWKSAPLAENVGAALVNGSLGYYDTYVVHLRRECSALFEKLHTLYKDPPKYFDGGRQTAEDHYFSCVGDGPCFVQTLDNFDILVESTRTILKRVAAPFENLVDSYGIYYVQSMWKAASNAQKADVQALSLVDFCAWHYHSSTPPLPLIHDPCGSRVECALRAADRIMGPSCEETDNATLMAFYDCYGCERWIPTDAPFSRCFHNALIRYTNYSARIYVSFVGTLGTFLLMKLDLFGFCRHIAEKKTPIANFTERRQEVVKLVQGIDTQLLRGKKVLKDHDAGNPKAWTELARPVVHSGIDAVANGTEFSYPSPDGAMEKYRKVGYAIIESIRANNFNEETYRYEIVIYKPEEVCLINSNEDIAQGDYRNLNYLVSRAQRRLTSALSSRVQKDNATIRTLFGQSAKEDLCERVRDVEDELEYKFTGPGGFRTMLVTKCARKFVWYELAWQLFDATWSTLNLHMFVARGNYDTQCVSVVLIP